MAKDKPRRNPLEPIEDIPAVLAARRPPAQQAKPRKKRKDATGQKDDYHIGTTTLAVRLPVDQAAQVRELAAAAGQSVNAWLAELIAARLGE